MVSKQETKKPAVTSKEVVKSVAKVQTKNK